MQSITKYLRFPFSFNPINLQRDLAAINDRDWAPHFNKRDYDGEWNIIALYSSDGDKSNIFASPTCESELTHTSLRSICPYLYEVISHFKFPLLTARLMKLKSGAVIKPHKDHSLGYEDGNFRIHIPIVTNEDVYFILDGVRLKMVAGECWYTNVNYEHSVRNKSTEDRIHLVLDFKRNMNSDKLFFSLAPEKSFFPERNEFQSLETLRRTIEELELSNNPLNKDLIHKLKLQLVTLKGD